MTSVEQIAVASGMVAEQERCSTAAAILILRIRSKASGSTLVATAAAVIDRHETEVR
jgi:hypothetical protein